MEPARRKAARRLLVGGAAVAGTVLILGSSGRLSPNRNPGAPSIQGAVDQYVAAVRAGDGAAMARILGTGYSARAGSR